MKKLIIFILIFVMCGFVFNKSIIKANTQVNNTLGYDSSFLYNETNTYQYDRKTEQKNYIDNNGNNGTENLVNQFYDMSNKNSNTVSIFGTVISHRVGIVTINGVYKYNSNLRVTIEINVINLKK